MRSFLAGGLCALVVITGGCGGDASPGGTGTGSETLVLAFMGPLTGDGASIGRHILNGAQLAIDEAAASRTLPVRLELKPFDTQLDPAQARTLADRILEDDRIVGVIGPVASGEVKAVAPTFEQAGVPIVTPSASNTELARQGWKVFHRIVANDDVQSAELARYISGHLKATRLAIIHDNTEYGNGLAVLTKSSLEARGVSVDIFDAIDPKGTDYSAVVNSVRARQSPVVFYAGLYNEAGRLVRQLRDAGVTATFLSGDGSKDPAIAAGGGSATEGVMVTCACADPSVADDPKARAFTGAYTARFGQPPGTYAAEAYDAANLFIGAVRRGARTTTDVLAAIGPDMEVFEGLTKPITFTASGEIATSTVYVYTFTDGRFTILGTTHDLATE